MKAKTGLMHLHIAMPCVARAVCTLAVRISNDSGLFTNYGQSVNQHALSTGCSVNV
jgi:hypothetical protein